MLVEGGVRMTGGERQFSSVVILDLKGSMPSSKEIMSGLARSQVLLYPMLGRSVLFRGQPRYCNALTTSSSYDIDVP